jgi:hypothetical protein
MDSVIVSNKQKASLENDYKTEGGGIAGKAQFSAGTGAGTSTAWIGAVSAG